MSEIKEIKDKVTFSLDKVTLDYLDQMRGLSPRSTYLNYIIVDYFKIQKNSERLSRAFEKLTATRPELVEKLLNDGLQASETLTDEEVKAITGK